MVASLCLTAGFLAGMTLNIFLFAPAIFVIAGSAFVFGLGTDVSHAAAIGLQAAVGLQLGYLIAMLARVSAGKAFVYWMARKGTVGPVELTYVRTPRATEGRQTF